jgi:hypothetical protein
MLAVIQNVDKPDRDIVALPCSIFQSRLWQMARQLPVFTLGPGLTPTASRLQERDQQSRITALLTAKEKCPNQRPLKSRFSATGTL